MSPCDNDFVERLHPRRDTRARSVHSGPFLLVAIIVIVASLSTLGQLRRRVGPLRFRRFKKPVYTMESLSLLVDDRAERALIGARFDATRA